MELSNRLPFLSAGAKAFVCDQCGAQFSKEDALETHRQTHTGELTLIPLLQVPHRVIARGYEVSPRRHPFSSDTHSFPGGAVSGAGWAGVTLPHKNSCAGLGQDLFLTGHGAPVFTEPSSTLFEALESP